MITKEYIESVFDVKLSEQFTQLFEKLAQYEPPYALEFPHYDFAFEIQYFVDMKSSKYHDVAHKYLVFAKSYDGHKLLLDLKSPTLEILQDEFGEIDELEINASDILKSTKID